MKKWALVIGLFIGLFIAIGAMVLFFRIEDQVAGLIRTELERSTPIRVRDLKLDITWKKLLSGNLGQLELTGVWESFEFQLSGAIQASRFENRTNQLRILWTPEINLSEKRLKIPKTISRIEALIDWKERKLLGFDFEWNPTKAEWTESDEKMIAVVQPHLKIGGHPLDFKVNAQWDQAEILWGEFYLDYPLSKQEHRIHYQKDHIVFEAGKDLSLDLVGVSTDLLKALVKFNRKALEYTAGDWVLRNASIKGEAEFIVPKRLLAQIDLLGDWFFKKWQSGDFKFKGQVKGFQLGSLRHQILLDGIDLSLNWDRGGEVVAEIPDIWIRRIRGGMKRVRIPLTQKESGIWEGMSDEPLKLDLGTNFPLSWQKVKIKLGREFSIRTGLRFQNWNLETVVRDLCLTKKPVPPTSVSLNLPLMEVEEEQALFQGEGKVSLFGGEIRVRDLALFDLWTDVPEIQFSADWKGVRLEDFGAWSGFGRMDGTLDGYWRDVVFQYWLPTEYDFFIQGSPYQGEDKMVFSPEAMRNFVRLFAGDELDKSLPGIAEWMAFGWPSRIFGGYDVYFVGLKAFAKDGSILVETLEPPNAPGVCKKAGNHFILCGPRFKIPIQSVHYPVVLDSPAVANLTRHVMRQVEGLKMEKKESQNEKSSNELSDQTDRSACVPSHPFFGR